MNNNNKELLKQFLLEEIDVEETEEVSEKDYESIIDKLGSFLATLEPDSLSDSSQEALFILYNSLAEVYDLDEEDKPEDLEDGTEDEDFEEDDNLDEVKVRRISRSKHRKSHLNYIKKKRKMGGKMKMKAKLARRTAKYKMWAKKYAKKKKAGRTGKIRYS